jgi:hypothetical protein
MGLLIIIIALIAGGYCLGRAHALIIQHYGSVNGWRHGTREPQEADSGN